MKSIVKIQDNKRNISLNIPKSIIEKTGIKKGDKVLIELREDGIIIIKSEY
ncbi:MAG: AbrB/MazE/SpoVT family DNA-binding domain-containing protein [Bacilli bacterium]|nr:AbrB/MazE/SpoVT family DNA-binding domain-containing protein [Bacilli bacterium]